MLFQLKKYYQILKEHPHPLRLVACRFICFAGLNHLLSIRRNGYDLKFYNSSISKNLWIHKNASIPDEVFLKDYLAAGDFVIDVGANIGNLTITSAHLLKGNRRQPSVYAIEPNPKIFRFLGSNIERNGVGPIVKAMNIALGENKGFISLSDKEDDGLNHVVFGKDNPSIAIERLDNLALGDITNVNLIKVDVEGFELSVFKGATGIFSMTNAIYLEYNYNHTRKFNYSFADIYDLLSSYEFEFYLPDFDDKTVVPLGRDFNSDTTVNILACKPNVLVERLKAYKIIRK